MSYPSRTTNLSYGGGCYPTCLASSLAGSYVLGQTFTVDDASTWYEIDENGHTTANPLGTSGPFTLAVDADLDSEEKILCSAVNRTTGVVTVWTDGTNNGRGYDGSPIFAHAAGTVADLNVYPLATATDQLQLRKGMIQAIGDAASAASAANAAQTTANTAEGHAQTALSNAATAQSTADTALGNAATAQSTANAKVASVAAANSTITVAGTSTAPTIAVTANTFDPYGAAASKVASVTATDSTITVSGTATAPTIAVTANVFDAYGAAASKVASVTAGDATITIAGTATAPTVKVAQANLTISESQVTNLTTDLANKVSTSAIGAANGVASLDGSGLVPASQIPPIAITETFVVSSQAAMLALTAQVGDVAVRTDIQTSFILQSVPASTLGNWVQILSPADGVTSITASSPLTGGTITSTGTIGIQSASTTQAGAVQLTDSTSSTSTSTAATPASVKSAYDLATTAEADAQTAISSAASKVASVTAGDSTITIGGTATAPTVKVSQANLTVSESQVTNLTTDLASKAPTSRSISTTSPLSGGGDLSADRTLSIADASTSAKGAVQLTDSTSSTSTTTAATPAAVKSAYDLASAALPLSGGTMSGAIAMGSNNITGLGAAPTALTNAATLSATPLLTPITFQNYKAWTCPVEIANGNSALVTGTVHVCAIQIAYTTSVSNIVLYVGSAGSSVTGSYVGLYSSTTLLGYSAAISTQWNSTGAKTHALTAQSAGSLTNLAPGTYYVAFLVGAATTPPSLVRSAGVTANFTVIGTTLGSTFNAKSMSMTTAGGYSSLPASSSGTIAGNSPIYWAALT